MRPRKHLAKLASSDHDWWRNPPQFHAQQWQQGLRDAPRPNLKKSVTRANVDADEGLYKANAKFKMHTGTIPAKLASSDHDRRRNRLQFHAQQWKQRPRASPDPI